MKDNISAFDAAEYDHEIKRTIPYYEDFYKQVVEVAKVQFENPVKWLDVGCGTGKMAEAAFGNIDIEKFVFYDNSAKMIESAGNRFESAKTEFITSSILDLEMSDQFDIITAIQVFHYFHNNERIEAAKRCYRALSAGGIFISFENFAPYSEAGRELYLKRWKAFQISQGKSITESEKHIKRYGKNYFPVTISEQVDVLRQCGFGTVEILWVSNMQVGLLGIK